MSVMANSSFDSVWVPRIGVEGANALKTNGYLTLIVWPISIATSILCSLAFGGHSLSSLLLGVLCMVLAIVSATIWMRSRLTFTAAVSKWFGVHFAWYEIPKMREKEFDAWCESHDLETPWRSEEALPNDASLCPSNE
jgi:hypothetical protein